MTSKILGCGAESYVLVRQDNNKKDYRITYRKALPLEHHRRNLTPSSLQERVMLEVSETEEELN